MRKPMVIARVTALPNFPMKRSWPMNSPREVSFRLNTSFHIGSKTVRESTITPDPALMIKKPIIALKVPLMT